MGAAEGLLLGTYSVSSTSSQTDEDDTGQETTSTTVVVHSFVTSGPRLSFYDRAAVLSEERLYDLRSARGDLSIVGWWVAQPRNGLRPPTVQNAAVHRSLSAAKSLRGVSSSELSPCVFFSLGHEQKTSEASSFFSYQCFSQPDPDSLALRPLPLEVSNMNGPDSQSQYASFSSCGVFGADLSLVTVPENALPLQNMFDQLLGSFDEKLGALEKAEGFNAKLRSENEAMRRILQCT